MTPLYSLVQQEKVSPSNHVSSYVLHRSTLCYSVLDAEGKTAFLNYLNKGGNFVGIHSASDSLNTTTFFGQEVGQRTHN